MGFECPYVNHPLATEPEKFCIKFEDECPFIKKQIVCPFGKHKQRS